MVIEFRVPGADKGAAIASFLAEAPFAGRVPVFAGDDVTDEAGFAEVNRRGGISVRIGGDAKTVAKWRLENATALIDWLGADPGIARRGRRSGKR
jgi:trehalose 6-phosphate phosphatase